MLREGETGLTFAPRDAYGLAQQIARLSVNPDLASRLARAARQTVLENFTLDRMVEEIETYLDGCLSAIPENRLGERAI
jgi:glycosyltransferase involved in cell wall biosynthesis